MLRWMITRRVLVQRCPAVPTAPKSNGPYRQTQVRTGGNDDRIVPTQFKECPSEATLYRLTDMASHAHATREGDERDAAVVDKAFSDVTALSDNDVENALRKATPVPFL